MKVTNNKLYYIGGLFTCVSSALVSHTKLPIPPALIIFGGSLLLFLFLFLSGFGSQRIPKYALVIMPFALFLIFTQPFTTASVKNYVGPIISALFFPLVVYFLNFLDKNKIYKIVYILIIVSVIMLTAETLYRYVFPNFEVQEISENRGSDDSFYMFKASSLMYTDSNGAAIHIAIVLFFTYYWSEFIKKKYFLVKLVLWLMLILTISRAAWIGSFVGFLYFKFLRGRSVFFWFSFGIISFISTLLLIFFYFIPLIEQDASFMARIEVIEQTVNYYRKGPDIIDQLIGIGVYQSKVLFDIYLHSFFIVQTVEMGYVSLILLFIMWGQLLYYSKGKALIILLPFTIITLSSTLSFLPVFYVVLAIVCTTERKIKINENSIHSTSLG